jgi:hypothetical protein
MITACGNGSEEADASSERHGFVDERYELVSLVARLAGRPEFNDTFTEYQRGLDARFGGFKEHPVVVHVRELGLTYDDFFNIAVHLDKTEGKFTSAESDTLFTERLNQFYIETNFGEFFREHAEYYREHSERFEVELFNSINFEWFRQYGLNPLNMHVILSPASSRMAYGARRDGDKEDDGLVFAGMPVAENYGSRFEQFVVHEFAHTFANPLADIWYAENIEFRRWADDSVDEIMNPAYASGIIMAYEYLTRAYTILYMTENHRSSLINLFLAEMSAGFPYAESVYALLTDHEAIEYALGGEHTFTMPDGRILTWSFIDLLGNELALDSFQHNQNGNLFGSQTGDVLYVSIDGAGFMYIDLGSAEHLGLSAEHRMYNVFPAQNKTP